VSHFLLGQPSKHLFAFGISSYFDSSRIEFVAALLSFHRHCQQISFIQFNASHIHVLSWSSPYCAKIAQMLFGLYYNIHYTCNQVSEYQDITKGQLKCG